MAGCKPIDKRGSLESRQAVWDAIRRLQTFSIPEVRDETLLKTDAVREYITGLAAAGYVRKTAEQAGVGVPAQWELARDAGNEAPRVRRDGSPVTQGQGRENMWQDRRQTGSDERETMVNHEKWYAATGYTGDFVA